MGAMTTLEVYGLGDIADSETSQVIDEGLLDGVLLCCVRCTTRPHRPQLEYYVSTPNTILQNGMESYDEPKVTSEKSAITIPPLEATVANKLPRQSLLLVLWSGGIQQTFLPI